MRYIAARVLACTLAAVLAATAQAQSPPQAHLTETSVTLAQIVKRQQDNYARMRNAEGQVVWHEDTGATTPLAGAPPPLRVIFFAFEGGKSVTLVLPLDDAQRVPSRREKVDWARVLSACFVEGDRVHTIRGGRGNGVPDVLTAPYNPAVHSRNPLVSFHPSICGDERVTLADLLASSSRMPTKPKVSEYTMDGRPRLRVEFANNAAQGELLYYVIDPEKGCLAEEIGRYRGGRPAMKTQIMIRPMRDGTWIPARREKVQWDAAGRVVSRESWYYQSLAVNEPMPRRMLSFDYFHLPKGTRFERRMENTAAPPDNAGK